MMSNELDMDVRLDVLNSALILERDINNILIELFNLSKDETKVFSYSSNNFSFQQKILLLKDLKHLSSSDYSSLDLFMQFRNQFMHNYYANSFEYVVKVINRKNELLKFNKNASIHNSDELLYFSCFKNLVIHNITIVHNVFKKVYKDKIAEIKINLSEANLRTENEYLKKIEQIFFETIKIL